MRLKDIVNHLTESGIVAVLEGDPDIEINQIAGLDRAQTGQISFLSDKKRLPQLKGSAASAIILKAESREHCPCAALVVDNPYYAYAVVAQLLNPTPQPSPGIHHTAVIALSAQIGNNVTIMAHATIGENVVIGDNSVIMAGCVLEDKVVIGADCKIGHNVVVMHHCEIGNNSTIEAGTVIGGDGFGWANHRGTWIKVPQIGKVIIGEGVSIGNNCTIDRGAIENTVIADGCIIDNLVHIAHNVQLGNGCAIAGQVGFAGSTTLGKHCTVAGQAGFAGHIHVADNTHILAKGGVTHNLKESGVYGGFPAIPVSEWQKNNVRSRQLDKMARQLKALEQEIELIKQRQSTETNSNL